MDCRRRDGIVETALEVATVIEMDAIRGKDETCAFALAMCIIVIFTVLHTLLKSLGENERIDVLSEEIGVTKHSPNRVVSCELSATHITTR